MGGRKKKTKKKEKKKEKRKGEENEEERETQNKSRKILFDPAINKFRPGTLLHLSPHSFFRLCRCDRAWQLHRDAVKKVRKTNMTGGVGMEGE